MKLETQNAVARHYGVSRTTVQNWLRRGMPEDDGTFCVEAIDRWLRDHDSPAAPRQELVRVDRAELERYIRHVHEYDAEIGRALLDALPKDALKVRVAGHSDKPTVRELLEGMVSTDQVRENSIRGELADLMR